MANPDHMEVLKRGVKAWNRWRKAHPEISPDFTRAFLWTAHLRRANLKNVNFTRANLRDSYLAEANLRGANLQYADLTGANLRDSILRDADLSRSNLTEANLVRSKLSNAVLKGANLLTADLTAIEARKADFGPIFRPDGSGYEPTFLIGASLKWADLREADFTFSILRNTNLTRANLSSSTLTFTDLQDAQLSEARLEGACIRDSPLSGADLTNARLAWTILSRLDLSETQGLDSVRHAGPSTVGTNTVSRSNGRIPESFLRGCGFSRWEVEAAKLHNPDLTPKQVDRTAKEIAQLRADSGYSSCFISYSHTDKPLAHRVYDNLQDRGVSCWLDEHDLKPGDRILDVVNDAIRIHDKILLCCSETSLNSWWVKDEIRKAQERERRDGRDIIIPLMVDRYLLDGWEDGLAADLRSRLAADFTGWETDNAKFDREFERVVKALRTGDGSHKQNRRS